MSICVCPKCGSQLEVKLTFASGPKKATDESSDIRELLEQAEARELNKWESDFISQLRERYDEYGNRVQMSDKQEAILRGIASGKKNG